MGSKPFEAVLNIKTVLYELCEHLTCNSLQQSAHIKDALLHDALKTHGEDGNERHSTQQQDPCSQEDRSSLPEPAGNLSKVDCIRSAQYSPLKVRFYTATINA